MGTRGVIGFHKNGVDKIAYNHYDSYPSELGNSVKQFIKKHNVEEMNEIFDHIVMVSNKIPPTKEQIEECKEQSTDDWYCLLHKAQGDLEVYFKDLRYMEDSASFLTQSLFCEWGYVINLTTGRLEIYRGFQKSPQANRYKVDKHTDLGEYFNCALIREVPFSQVKNFNMDTLEKEISKEECDDDE
jgi:hypothetical protein